MKSQYESIKFADIGSALGGGSGYGAYGGCAIFILALTPTPILTLTQNLTLSVTMTTNLIKTPTITHTMNLTVILSFRKCDERNYFFRVL